MSGSKRKDFVSPQSGLQKVTVENPPALNVATTDIRTIGQEIDDAIAYLNSDVNLSSPEKVKNAIALLSDVSKNKFPLDRSGLQVIINAATNDTVDSVLLAKVLLKSNKQNKKERKIYRKIASLQDPQSIKEVHLAMMVSRITISRESRQIIDDSANHEMTKYNLANISQRNDAAGILQKKFDYYDNHRNYLYKDFLEKNPQLDSKYKQSKALAESITTKHTQIDVLNNIEINLNQLQNQNNSLDSLRRKPSFIKKIFTRPQPKPYEIIVKSHVKDENKFIDKRLKIIKKERKKILVDVKKEEKKSIVVGDELMKLRRETIQSMTNSENKSKISASDKVTLLAENVKCELTEKKNLIDARIANLNELNKKSSNPAITKRLGQQKQLSDELGKLINGTDKIIENNSLFARQNLQTLKSIVHAPEFKSLGMLQDIRKKGFDKPHSLIKHDFVKNKQDNLADRDNIRNKISKISINNSSDTLPKALDKAISLNNDMLVKLQHQKDYLIGNDSFQKNQTRMRKYEQSIVAFHDVKEKLAELQKVDTDPERKRMIVKEIKTYSTSDVFPKSTQDFMKNVQHQAEKHYVEQIKAAALANKKNVSDRGVTYTSSSSKKSH